MSAFDSVIIERKCERFITEKINFMLGIICALPEEARCFNFFNQLNNLKLSLKIGQIIALDSQHLLYISGMGQERASQAAHILIAKGARALLSWGTAGGLCPQLKAGDIIIPQEVRNHDASQRYFMSTGWQQSLYQQAQQLGLAYQGSLIHSTTTLHNPQQKNKLFETQGAIAVDMETLAIAKIAGEKKLPMACMRVIVDPAHFNLPVTATEALSPEGQLQWRSLLWNLIRYPQEWSALYRLSRFFRQTQQTLERLTQLDLLPE